MTLLTRKRNGWFVFGLLILCSNYLLYRTHTGVNLITTEVNGVVIGSLIDLAILAPLAFMLTHDRFSLKKFIIYAAIGCMAARFIIPMEFLQPFVMFTWVGFAVEGLIVLIEIIIVLSIFVYLPKIIALVRESSLPTVFSFPEAIKRYIRSNKIVQILSSELLMFYYALGTWRQKEQQGITLYKNTSYIAMQLMIIHAIILETIGIHWWLHDVSPIVSIILLCFNIYSVFFFIGDMQAMRLTPIVFEENELYISAGLMKQVKIPYELIEEIVTDQQVLAQKLKKDTLQFIVRDFEALEPQIILRMKEPVTATYYLGVEKKYTKIAIRVDQPDRFLQMMGLKVNR